VRQVGKDLGISYVLEGSIQRQNERIRASAQLIDARSGTHLWSDRWDRPVEDVFAMQTEISEQLANKLGSSSGVIEEAGRQAARRKRPENLDAYELYLLGTDKLAQITRESVAEALQLLTRAVEMDPTLARAWVELSFAHSLTGRYGGDREAAVRAATDAARRAVEADPSDAEAHAMLGNMLARAGDFERAEAAFDEALRLNPGSAEILTRYSGWASTFGKPERGADAADKAIRLNPNYPASQANGFSWAYFSAGRYEDARRTIERQSAENWNQGTAVLRTAIYAALGRTDEARKAVAEVLKRFPELTIEGFLSQPEFNDVERQHLIKTLRAAGFPACARPEELAQFAKPTRLPECINP
jgi:tetratricopeptide (TPR) repeat protein